jgi:alcohol dehydrogenase, propanol-preferring
MTMRAMLLDRPGEPLRAAEVPEPTPDPGQLRVRVTACGVCRTDLHVRDGELPHPALPLILGHQVVGTVDLVGAGVDTWSVGDRVGIPWLAWTCGECRQCVAGRENLCERARFTGYTVEGGFAEAVVADARYVVPIPHGYGDVEAAPLLCAGLIGYRALRLAGEAQRLGLYGFGAAAHLVAQVAMARGVEVFAFTRPGDTSGQDFARRLGAAWAGGSDEAPPVPLDAAIVFAPVGALVPQALSAVGPGGWLVCGGIHMSDIPSFPYSILWEERSVTSVANLTRADAAEFMAEAATTRLDVSAEALPLEDAETALSRLRSGDVEGALVLVP